MVLVHLVYIHGFRGDHTTFQAFPTDLQQYLSAHIPSHLDVNFKSSLYPTYKSVKPISHATKNFLEWLATQPPGPVILLGHSMGGLLAAEAAIDPSNFQVAERYPGAKPRRIVGMIAFDTPYLGMHPHVVISGIASLFAKEDERTNATENELNDERDVHIVDEKVTDDWESFKRNLDAKTSRSSVNLATLLPSPPLLSPPNSQTSTMLGPLSPSIPLGLPPSPMVDRAVNFLNEHSNDPLVRWVRKHSDEPFTSGKRWIIEHFQFGSCMFDPSGLKTRYTRLVAWPGGMWINYWTQTIPKPKELGNSHSPSPSSTDEGQDADFDNDIALVQTGMADRISISTGTTTSSSFYTAPASEAGTPLVESGSPTQGPQSKAEAKALEKAAGKTVKAEEKERKKAAKERVKLLKRSQKEHEQSKEGKDQSKTKGRHFIVLPTGLGQILGGGENWEKISIAGAEDEVAAHCGLFIREQNLEYDAFVERVGKRVFAWCERL